MSGPETIYLVRHGESEANVDPLCYAQGDHAVGLTEHGLEQAARAADGVRRSIAERFGDDALPVVWTSPYKRCRQTAHVFAETLAAPLRESVLIREQEYGLFDGLTDAEAEARYPEWIGRQKRLTLSLGKFYFRYPGGESRADVAQRVHQFFDSLERETFEPIVVVSHGVTFRAFLMMWLNKTVEWFEQEKNPGNAAVRLIHRGADLGYLG